MKHKPLNFSRFIAISAIISAILSPTAVAQSEETTPSFSELDRQKAIIRCMTLEYVGFYQEHPAEADAMDICNARFQRLTQEIPYENYKQWVLDTPYSPYPAAETSAIQEQYNHIMFGIDPQIPFIVE